MNTFYTVTDHNTQKTNSQSSRYTLEEAEREAIARIRRGVEGVFILKAVKYLCVSTPPIRAINLE